MSAHDNADRGAAPQRRRRTHSLRAKFISVVLLTTLAALAVALGAMVAYDLRAYHEAWLSDMSTQAELLGQTSAPALSFDDPRVAQENLALLRLRPQIRAAAVYGPKGTLFASYAATPGEASFPPAPEPDAVSVRGRDLIVFKHVVANGEALGTVYLRANYELYSRVLSYGGIALAVALAAMLVAFVLSSRLQKIVTRPILAISMIAREVVEQNDYSRRAERLSDDEVGELVVAFNGMMAEVQRRTAELERSLAENATEVAERRAVQLEVMRLNTQLEQRVRDRTAGLEASNRELALATASAERANDAKSEFISSMSHELRTPLNAILGFGQLLAMESFDLPAEKRHEFTRHILKAGGHLLSLIDEILDLARIDSANLTLSLEPVALAEILDECRTMIGPAAEKRGIRLLLPSEVRLGVVADRTRLRQIVLNLLSNAIKYNRDNGMVIVDAKATESGDVRLVVQDTGAGLRQDQLDALFQPFNRLGQEAGSIEGTGIGLVVTKRLVELMGGRIGVSSTPGVGSAFWVELKQCAERHVASPPSSTALRAAGGASSPALQSEQRPLLLHVEDNPANLELVEAIVSIRGDLRQISAPDAQLGIELARAHAPQVILMDINLPGLSGRDALALLRADPRTATIPVIAVTANAMPRDRLLGAAAGFFRYVTKPIEVADLNAAIDDALQSGAAGPAG